jgi:hypothetical protein
MFQKSDRNQGFYQLQVFAQLVRHLSPSDILPDVPVTDHRNGMALLKLRQIHEFKVMTGSKYGRDRVSSLSCKRCHLGHGWLFALHCLQLDSFSL